jgi:hypothetical protein
LSFDVVISTGHAVRAAQHPNVTRSYNETTFPKLGKCTSYPVSHQYSYADIYNKAGVKEATKFYDLIDYSCLNGWAMGNIARAQLYGLHLAARHPPSAVVGPNMSTLWL